MNQTFSFEFEHKRHFNCGRLYYIEKGISELCPYCARTRDNEHSESRDRWNREQERLGRVIRGLRGALKRAKVRP